MLRWNVAKSTRWFRRIHREDVGSASLEFLGVGVVLLLAVMYAMIALNTIESAALATELAARNAARTLVADGYPADGAALAEAQIAAALEAQGHHSEYAQVEIYCHPAPDCAISGEGLTVRVSLRVGLPFVPGASDWLAIPVSGESTFPRTQ